MFVSLDPIHTSLQCRATQTGGWICSVFGGWGVHLDGYLDMLDFPNKKGPSSRGHFTKSGVNS